MILPFMLRERNVGGRGINENKNEIVNTQERNMVGFRVFSELALFCLFCFGMNEECVVGICGWK
jgi:hypothetical protein